MTQTIIDNEYVSMWYYPDKKIIHHEFHKFTYGQELRDVLEAGTKLIQQYGVQKWLSDNRKRGPLKQEDMEWTQTVWFPQALASGWKYWGLVMPEKAAGQMSMQRAVNNYREMGIITEIFDDADKALKWLESL